MLLFPSCQSWKSWLAPSCSFALSFGICKWPSLVIFNLSDPVEPTEPAPVTPVLNVIPAVSVPILKPLLFEPKYPEAMPVAIILTSEFTLQ